MLGRLLSLSHTKWVLYCIWLVCCCSQDVGTFKLIHPDMKFDPNSNPPSFASDEQVSSHSQRCASHPNELNPTDHREKYKSQTKNRRYPCWRHWNRTLLSVLHICLTCAPCSSSRLVQSRKTIWASLIEIAYTHISSLLCLYAFVYIFTPPLYFVCPTMTTTTFVRHGFGYNYSWSFRGASQTNRVGRVHSSVGSFLQIRPSQIY